ncbi:MAG: winged helix-turn-helix domain-containing protein [Chloroflexota bacterium]
MTAIHNPYTTMLLTFDAARFQGRENEVISILKVISAPDPTGYALYGIRSIGKTTLLKFLMSKKGALERYRKELSPEFEPGGGKQFLFVYINFHHYQPGVDVLKMLALELQHTLIERAIYEHTMEILDESVTRAEAMTVMRRALRNLHGEGVRVVFLLDDFDEVMSEISSEDDRLLRVIGDDAALILATDRAITEIRPEIAESSPLMGILRPQSIALLTETAARRLIAGPAAGGGLKFDEVDQDFLLHVAGRQPFFLITACEALFDTYTEYPEVRELIRQESDTFHSQFVGQVLGLPHTINLLDRIWADLEDDEQRALYALAQGRSVTMPDQIRTRLALKALVQVDPRHGETRLFSETFRQYLLQRLARNARSRGKNGAEDRAQEIMVQLTPIDRALFGYLVDHKERVCTFDELLMAVWPEGERSKRALEAAVHRIRRVLEPGEQIRNIRGTGYQFMRQN